MSYLPPDSTQRFLQEIQEALKQFQSPSTLDAVLDRLAQLTGRVVTCGLGKSGHCAHLLASSLRSLGMAAEFLHAAEALHGDMGSLRHDDLLLFFSHSGKTQECLLLASYAQTHALPCITITSHGDSPLARMSEHVLIYPPEELCHFGRAPSLSLIYMTVISQLISMSLHVRSNRSESDYLESHPAGTLGHDGLRVQQVYLPLVKTVRVSEHTSLKSTLEQMQDARLGSALVAESETVLGLFTDGDLRRALLKGATLDDPIGPWMTRSPKTVDLDDNLASVKRLFREHSITSAPVRDKDGALCGLITHIQLGMIA